MTECVACDCQEQAPRGAKLGAAFARGFAFCGFVAADRDLRSFSSIVALMCAEHRAEVDQILSAMARRCGLDVVATVAKLGAEPRRNE